MGTLATLAQALGVSYAAGINLYATVAILGIADRLDLIGPLPGALAPVSSIVIILLAATLYVFEFLATLVPGIASVWETFHTLVRPPAAALLAAATVWHGDAGLMLAAGLLGGGLALTTHTAKLGLRYAVDTSPEPVTNGVANITELGVVAAVAVFVWQHPYITLALALLLLIAMILAVRAVWRLLRRVFSGRWVRRRSDLEDSVEASATRR